MNVAATLSGCGRRSSSDSNFFNSDWADDVFESMNCFTASLTCASSAGLGRGMATANGTGAGGPITTTRGFCSPETEVHAPATNRALMTMEIDRFMTMSLRRSAALRYST